jgi:hypothetical protein
MSGCERNYSAPQRGARIYSRGLASGASVTSGMPAANVLHPGGVKEILSPLRGADTTFEHLPRVARFALNPWLPSLHSSGVLHSCNKSRI